MDESGLSEEMAALFGAVSGWARENLPPPQGGMAGSTCEWCPVCQFVAVVRGERPELTDRVVETGSALIAAMRTLLESAPTPRPRPRPRPRPNLDSQ